MRWITRWGSLAVLAVAALTSTTSAAERTAKDASNFGSLTPPTEVSVRVQAYNWLKEQGKADGEIRKAFDELWAQKETPVLDKLAATFCLGSPEVKQLLDQASDFNAAAPTELPALLKDTSRPAFFRANLALAYAKALSNRKVYEEALETLRLFKAEQVVDPSSFLFHKAVAEHALMIKKDANETIARLLDDVPSAPERYKMVAALMHFDMVSWQDKDLGSIGRKMDNIQRRLDLSRGGKKTQKLQKEVVMRLDEIIKELENQQNQQQGDPNGGNCPSGGQAQKPGNGGGAKPSAPMADSNIATNSGPGQIDAKKLQELAEQWGKLPAREREASMRELTRDMPERYREIIREYFRKLSLQDETVNR